MGEAGRPAADSLVSVADSRLVGHIPVADSRPAERSPAAVLVDMPVLAVAAVGSALHNAQHESPLSKRSISLLQ